MSKASIRIWKLAAAAILSMVAAQAAAEPATTVTGVVVGGPAPKVVSSYPADGSQFPAGTLVLKITFDQAMTPHGWSYGRTPDGVFPHCLAEPRLLADQRTFALLCTAAEHQTYAIKINAPTDFKSEYGRSASPTELHFTTAETGPRSIHDALLQAGLTDADDPVMTWRDPGSGVSQSASAPDEH